MDFLISPLGWKNWLLLIAAFINLGMAIFIFSRGVRRNKINLYFSFLTFFTFFWSFNIFLQIVLIDIFWVKFWFQTSFVSALGIAIFLFYFIINFPFQNIYLKNSLQYLLWSSILILSIISYTQWNILSFDKIINNNLFVIEYSPLFQLAYSIFFVSLVFYSLLILWLKYRQAEVLLKKSILLLFWTLFFGLSFGFYFNLFLDLLGNFKYEWLGPLFTVPMNLVVFYLVFFNKEK